MVMIVSVVKDYFTSELWGGGLVRERPRCRMRVSANSFPERSETIPLFAESSAFLCERISPDQIERARHCLLVLLVIAHGFDKIASSLHNIVIS